MNIQILATILSGKKDHIQWSISTSTLGPFCEFLLHKRKNLFTFLSWIHKVSTGPTAHWSKWVYLHVSLMVWAPTVVYTIKSTLFATQNGSIVSGVSPLSISLCEYCIKSTSPMADLIPWWVRWYTRKSWLQSRQVENAEVRKAKYGNWSMQVKSKAAYRRLVPYWLTTVCVEAL